MTDLALRGFGLLVLLLAHPLMRRAAAQDSVVTRGALGLSALGALTAGATLLVTGADGSAPTPVVLLAVLFLAGASVLGVIEVVREIVRGHPTS